MMRKIVYIAALLVLLPVAVSRASEGRAGQAGAFLQVPVGARPTALGGAYLAVSDDGAAPLFNPAGLADLKRPLFGSSYRHLALDRKMGYVTVMFPAKGNAAVGVHWLYAGAGDVAVRDQEGREAGIDLTFNNHVFSAVFAKRFENYLSAGLKASYLHSTFAEMTAFTVSLDVGLMFYISRFFNREKRELMPVQDIRAGIVVKHLAAEYRWNNQNYLEVYGDPSALSSDRDDRVPIEVGVGISARFLDRKLMAAIDVKKNEKLDPAFHAGAEYLVSEQFAVRGGYSDRRFVAGTGYLFEVRKRLMAIDYAFSTGKVGEGSEHIFSLDILF